MTSTTTLKPGTVYWHHYEDYRGAHARPVELVSVDGEIANVRAVHDGRISGVDYFVSVDALVANTAEDLHPNQALIVLAFRAGATPVEIAARTNQILPVVKAVLNSVTADVTSADLYAVAVAR